jgi:hypothetical protein
MLGTKAELKKTPLLSRVEGKILPRTVLPMLKSGMIMRTIATELKVSVKQATNSSMLPK